MVILSAIDEWHVNNTIYMASTCLLKLLVNFARYFSSFDVQKGSSAFC
jgi:hypothetical protein